MTSCNQKVRGLNGGLRIVVPANLSDELTVAIRLGAGVQVN